MYDTCVKTIYKIHLAVIHYRFFVKLTETEPCNAFVVLIMKFGHILIALLLCVINFSSIWFFRFSHVFQNPHYWTVKTGPFQIHYWLVSCYHWSSSCRLSFAIDEVGWFGHQAAVAQWAWGANTFVRWARGAPMHQNQNLEGLFCCPNRQLGEACSQAHPWHLWSDAWSSEIVQCGLGWLCAINSCGQVRNRGC